MLPTTLTVKRPIVGIKKNVFDDGFDLGLVLFEIYKDRLLERYNIQKSHITILDEDDTVFYYKDTKGEGIRFKKPVPVKKLLKDVREYNDGEIS